MTKVIQISDCHISARADAIYRGINPRDTLESLLKTIKAAKPDALLVTGDLAEDGSEPAYQYLHQTLEKLNVPILTVPGNHDRARLQTRYFPNTPVDQALVFDLPGWQLILLNSVIEGEVPGTLSASMMKSLERAVLNSDLPCIVVLHHQAVLCGSPWIDRFPLLNPEELLFVLGNRKNIKAVLWGHIHQEYSSQHYAVSLLGAPSTAANSQTGCEKFTFDETGPSFRWMTLGPLGEFATGINTAPGRY
ncbi:MAG: Icc protein [Lysobacterales bacterium]|jgi:Icc protein